LRRWAHRNHTALRQGGPALRKAVEGLGDREDVPLAAEPCETAEGWVVVARQAIEH